MPSEKRKESQHNFPLQPPAKKLKEAYPSDAEFQVVRAALTLSVPPVFATNPRAGVEEMLDSMIMRYIPSLQGVVLSHSNLVFTDKEAVIQRDCPFLICKTAFDATVWSPRVGFKLSGKVNLCSPDHISLLIHRTFNVSIPRNHVPTGIWEFEYGPAENDPQFGAGDNEDGEKREHEKEHDHQGGGKWVHKVTGDVIGGSTGLLEFTVVGLTVANEMLSLLGSLQPDPFSPRHAVTQQPETRKEDPEISTSDEEEDLEKTSKSGSGSEEEGDEDSELDTFQALGKRRDIEGAKEKSIPGNKRKQG